MTRRNSLRPATASLLVWCDFMRKTAEMMSASAQVIARRSGRMMLAGPRPSARDRDEFTLMGSEKIAASADAWQGLATQMTRLNLELGSRWFLQSLAATSSLASLAGSRTVGQALGRQSALIKDALSLGIAESSRLSRSAARLAHAGLKPLHRRATGNAKRLGRRS